MECCRSQTAAHPAPDIEKPVDNEKNALDIASYKLYYVYYEISRIPFLPQSRQ